MSLNHFPTNIGPLKNFSSAPKGEEYANFVNKCQLAIIRFDAENGREGVCNKGQ